jgi:hypothetical protein
MKHTPGPWLAGTVTNGGGKVLDHEAFVHDQTCENLHVNISSNSAAADAHLIAAAPDLLRCQTMGAEANTPDFLDWIAARLVKHHGENPHVDFVLSLKERAAAGRAAIAKATGAAQ